VKPPLSALVSMLKNSKKETSRTKEEVCCV
jgi:hypothetical protein